MITWRKINPPHASGRVFKPRCHPAWAAAQWSANKKTSSERDESISRVATHIAVRPTFAALSGGARHDSSPAAPGRNRMPGRRLAPSAGSLQARKHLASLSTRCRVNLFLIIVHPFRKVKCLFARNIRRGRESFSGISRGGGCRQESAARRCEL